MRAHKARVQAQRAPAQKSGEPIVQSLVGYPGNLTLMKASKNGYSRGRSVRGERDVNPHEVTSMKCEWTRRVRKNRVVGYGMQLGLHNTRVPRGGIGYPADDLRRTPERVSILTCRCFGRLIQIGRQNPVRQRPAFEPGRHLGRIRQRARRPDLTGVRSQCGKRRVPGLAPGS